MSRKPTIIIRYPEASRKALQLTEAMVKRAPGKRVVETESEDPIFPDGGELFSSFIRCKTQTGVELTLTLNSSSMDYALETLIRPNLTADERKEILGEDVEPEQAELPIPAQAAADTSTRTEEVGTLREPTKDTASGDDKAATQSEAAEEKIEIGKISDKRLRGILAEMICALNADEDVETCIETAVNEMNHAAGVIDLQETYKSETDNNLTRLLAVLLYAAPDPDWDRDDISNFADVVFTTANSTREKFIDIGTLCELMMESEYIATEMKSDATTHGILERLEKQEGEHAKHKPEKADARRQIAQALAALIYWTPRNLNNKKQRDSIQMACIYLWRCMEKYPAALILAREIANSLSHIATEVDNGYKPSDIYNCIEREITGCWAGAIPEFKKEEILVFPSDTAAEEELRLGEEPEDGNRR